MGTPFLKDGSVLQMPFVQFDAYFSILRHEDTVVMPGTSAGYYGYLGDVTTLSTSGAKEIQDASARYLLEPSDKYEINHIGFGIAPSRAEVYMFYPPSTARGNLRDVIRQVDGKFGFTQGEESSYRQPDLARTEFFTLKDLHPAFDSRNPTGTTQSIKLKFVVRRYYVELIKNQATVDHIRQYGLAVRKTIGGNSLLGAPSWLVDLMEAR